MTTDPPPCPGCDHPVHDELGCTVDGCVCEWAEPVGPVNSEGEHRA